MTERTLILVKPDGVERNLTGQVLARFERKGYRIAELKMLVPSRELLEQHYAEHEGKPFYEPLVSYMGSGPVVALVLEGNGVVAVDKRVAQRVVEGARTLMGSSHPTTAAPGTIRGDFGRDWGESVQKNLVHGSDSSESADREIALWFGA